MAEDMGELRNKVINYLQGHNAMCLATAHDGRAHAATVFYVSDHLDLFFISSPSSRHGRHLAADNRIAATVNEDYHTWNDIKGLQLEGLTEALGSPAENRDIAELFVAKFPDTSLFFQNPGDMPDAVRNKVTKVQFYRLRPTRIFYIDNSQGFGHREELPIDDSTPVGNKHDRIQNDF
jgi:uncharacterized protein YhbP (UPF0306 family)